MEQALYNSYDVAVIQEPCCLKYMPMCSRDYNYWFIYSVAEWHYTFTKGELLANEKLQSRKTSVGSLLHQ